MYISYWVELVRVVKQKYSGNGFTHRVYNRQLFPALDKLCQKQQLLQIQTCYIDITHWYITVRLLNILWRNVYWYNVSWHGQQPRYQKQDDLQVPSTVIVAKYKIKVVYYIQCLFSSDIYYNDFFKCQKSVYFVNFFLQFLPNNKLSLVL